MRALVSLSNINLLPNNPKKHDIPGLIRSFKTFGYLGAIVVNQSNMLDLSGNGRVEALRIMKAEGKPAPAGVTVDFDDGGEWVIEADLREYDEKTQLAVSNALNKIQDNGGVDEALLAEVLAQYADDEQLIVASGYDVDWVTSLLLEHGEEPVFNAEGGGGGGATEPVNNSATPPVVAPASHVRMIQLFYDTSSQPKFLEYCEELIASGDFRVNGDGDPVANISELVLEVLRRESMIKLHSFHRQVLTIVGNMSIF